MASRTILFAHTIIFLTLVAVAFMSAWATAAHAEEAKVKIDNFTFDPPLLKVKAGTTVTWTNEDDIPHTVAATSRAFKSKPLDTDEKYSFTFTAPGSYEYFCSLHPHMKATIVVEEATGRK
jgi:amicyanin